MPSARDLAELELGACVPATPIGRATRVAFSGGEVLRLAANDPAARRLADLGRERIGGVVESGTDAEGAWLVRRFQGPTLAAALRARQEPWPADESISIALGITTALAACARAKQSLGALRPEDVRLEGGVMLAAPALVAELLGASPARAEFSPSWTPPEQADGAPWDTAANLYVLGLVLYRMLSGEAAFAGGLRASLGEARAREAAPFSSELASRLPPGLMGLTLRLLAPRAEERPRDARAVASELARFTGGASARLAALDAASKRASIEDATPASGSLDRPKPATRRVFELRRFAPIAAGALIALAAAVALASSSASNRPTREGALPVAPREPLAAAHTRVEDCASCHPRQAAEWSRSVMAHAAKSPLFNALESLIEEQVGREDACPNGAGILRKVDPSRACRDAKSGLVVTGSGGEHWCVNCHSPLEKLDRSLPAWDGRPGGDASSRAPVRNLLGPRAEEGISCAFCHAVSGPAAVHGSSTRIAGYEGNATWTSFLTGRVFASRPEDARGLFGIANSGYRIDEDELVPRGAIVTLAGGAHTRPDSAARSYLAKSEFCGACHDVRLFGSDAIGVQRGEHFKRLRNAYSEWAAWAKDEQRAGHTAASCQDCHMSRFPGTCEPGEGDPSDDCPKATHLVAREPGSYARGGVATSSAFEGEITNHFFSGVDVPLARDFDPSLFDEPTIDARGTPLSARRRRDLLLKKAVRFSLGAPSLAGDRLNVPIEVENVGAGHRVPAGFSQERELWVHLVVKDAIGAIVYEVGKVARGDEDLHDKIFERVNVSPDSLDAKGRPEGLFGADVRDGPDAPSWSPPPGTQGATSFRGKGLVNFQNGFFRCVRCIGTLTPDGRCEAGPGQEGHRADRFVDGDYDLDSGVCTSNLVGERALYETYFPVGALDARRGLAKGPDAILDTRSLAPNTPMRFAFELSTRGRRGPFSVEAELQFRAFPPFLVRAFAAYEREEARRGKRPSGPLVTDEALSRLEVVTLSRKTAEVAR